MRFAVNIPNFGDYADPRVVADLARQAEEAGWDGLFVWDHVVHHKDLRREIADPWILLTAAALATSEVTAFLTECRAEAGRDSAPFDLLISGSSTPEMAADVVGPLAEAGATWWQECQWDKRLDRAEPMVQRAAAGPPLAR
jgi:hypothetical protein